MVHIFKSISEGNLIYLRDNSPQFTKFINSNLTDYFYVGSYEDTKEGGKPC